MCVQCSHASVGLAQARPNKILDNINCQNWTNLTEKSEDFSTSKSYIQDPIQLSKIWKTAQVYSQSITELPTLAQDSYLL